MVRLRLQRLGRKNRPFYRLSAIDSRTRRDGAVIEALGWYDPLAAEGKQLQLNDERTKYWLAKGAQPSDTVMNILAKRNLVDVKSWESSRGHERRKLEARVAAAAAAGDAKDEKKA
ncbi:MAG: 30S ribosomal protein S16 [Planctomycetota bacterium]|nr:30S ribosomal protein S16 [Planctomycetota bacterium]